MPCLQPVRGDSAQLLLYKIASCLAEAPGGAGVSSFNGFTGDVVFTGGDIITLLGFTPISESDGDARYVLKSGDTMTGALVHPVGSAAAPSVTFTGDLDTGIFHNAADSISFSTNGSVKFTIGTVFAQLTLHLIGTSGDISGSWTADSLAAASILDSPLSTTLASNNISGIVNIGNLTLDPNDPPVVAHVFLGNGNIGFFIATPVAQQAAPGNTLAEVLTALRNYGLLVP